MARAATFALLVFACIALATAYSDRGIVNLDDLTFDKVWEADLLWKLCPAGTFHSWA